MFVLVFPAQHWYTPFQFVNLRTNNFFFFKIFNNLCHEDAHEILEDAGPNPRVRVRVRVSYLRPILPYCFLILGCNFSCAILLIFERSEGLALGLHLGLELTILNKTIYLYYYFLRIYTVDTMRVQTVYKKNIKFITQFWR